MAKGNASRGSFLELAPYALFGLWFVWSAPFGTTEDSVFPTLAAHPGALLSSRIVLLVAFGASCAAVALLGRWLAPIRERRALLWACGGVTAAGMLLGGLPAFGLPLWLLFLGSALRGAASGFFVLSWIDRLAGLGAREVGIALCAALALYGAAGVGIPLAAAACAPVGLLLLVACPLLSCWACVRLARRPERKRPVVQPEPMSKLSAVLFAASNLVYGFVFGIMLSHFSSLGNTGLYAAFGVAAALALVAFAATRGPVDLAGAFRVCMGVGAAALVAAVLLAEAVPALVGVVEACLWALMIFFTVIIFTDAEFALPGRPCFVGGMALAAAACGMLAATLLVPPTQTDSLASPLLIAATLSGMLYLALVFLRGRQGWTGSWGFSSFVESESQETFRMRRSGELTAQHGLTKREFEVLEMLAAGQNKNEISEALVLSPLTVKTHIRNIYAKLGVHTQRELIELVQEGREEED